MIHPETNPESSPDGEESLTHLDHDMLNLLWNQNRLTVRAIDAQCFVADASNITPQLAKLIVQSSASQTAQPPKHSAGIVLDDHSSEVDIAFQVIEIHENLIRCKFTHLSDDQEQEITAIRAGLAMRKQQHDQLTNEPDAMPNSAVQPSPKSKSRPSQVRNGLLAVGVATVAFLGLASRNQLTPDTPSTFSDVTLLYKLSPIEASQTGTLSSLYVAPGDEVAKGQVIGQIDVASDLPAMTDRQAQVTQLQERLALLRTRRESLEKTLELTARKLILDLRVEAAELARLESELEAAQAQIARIQPLVADGSVSPGEGKQLNAQRDALLAAVDKQSAVLERMQLKDEAQQSEIALDEHGAQSLMDVRAQIELASRELNHQIAASDEISSPKLTTVDLIATVAGTIASVDVVVGETVIANRPLATVRCLDPSAATAMVTLDAAASMTVGQEVQVRWSRLNQQGVGKIQSLQPATPAKGVVHAKGVMMAEVVLMPPTDELFASVTKDEAIEIQLK